VRPSVSLMVSVVLHAVVLDSRDRNATSVRSR
jgi:hypothetical protein